MVGRSGEGQAAPTGVGDRLPVVRQVGADEPVLVFAPVSLNHALDEILRRWQRQQRGLAMVSYAGTPMLARQIQQGEPADIFISADGWWMDTLRIVERVDPASVRTFVRNRLVIIAPVTDRRRERGNKVPLASEALPLADWLGDSGKLAMADDRSDPSGRYGREALTHIGWYSRVRERLTGSATVRQALALVARGECPLGIVYASDAATEPRVRTVARFADGSHTPIDYQAARVATRDHPRTDELLTWLGSPVAAAALRQYGFVTSR